MKKKKWLARSAVVAALLIVAIITAVVSVRALAFEDYYVTEDNSFRVTIKQNKASSSATVKYSTAGWYLFPKQIDAADRDNVDITKYPGYSTFNASFYSGAGFPLSTSTNNRVDRQELGSFYYDTYEWSAETMLSAMQKWIKAGQLNRDQLSNGITLYASRPLTIKKNNSPIRTVYSYQEMVSFSEANGIDWSSKSWDTFKNETYDIPIIVQFAKVGMSYLVVDEKGNEIIEHNGITGFTYPDVYYGETITTNSPGKIMGYEYVGWELSAGNFKITGSTPSVNYTASFDDINGNDLVLTFKYKTADADMPFQSPAPEPTRAPGATATPTPRPTATPTPAPPTPTAQPSGQTEDWQSKDWYFSTDQGYYIDKVASSSTHYTAHMGSVDANPVATSGYTCRDNSYTVGYDSNGNEWYFYGNGSEALLVHPKKYNGYVVDSENIKYITELVFPSTIKTLSGTSYTVTSIGGGTAKYKVFCLDFEILGNTPNIKITQEVPMKKRKPIVLSEVKPEEMKKYEIAKELGLLDKVLTDGWQSLSAKETGKIGGMLSRAAKEAKTVKVVK